MRGKINTFIMWDPDALPHGYLHWIITNLDENLTPHTIVHYRRPTPPSGVHRYYFGLFVGPAVSPAAIPAERSGFNINEFIVRNGLTRVSDLLYINVPSEASQEHQKRLTHILS